MRVSASDLRMNLDKVKYDIITAHMQNNVRAILYSGGAVAAMTDNSTGVAPSNIAPVNLLTAYGYTTGQTGVDKTAFNAAIGKADDAISVLSNWLNSKGLTPLGLPTVTANASGVVTTPGTVPAMDKTVLQSDGAQQASGTITFSTAVPANNDTITVGATAITFKTSGATGNQINIGASLAAVATDVAAFINANTVALGVNATAAGAVVTVRANAGGTAGNAIALAKSGTNIAVSGANLTGGAATATGLLRSQANVAISSLRNNLATVLREYNALAVAVGVATIKDGTGGKADLGNSRDPSTKLFIAPKLEDVVDAATGTLNSGDLAQKTQVDAALTAIAGAVAKLAAKINSDLLATAVINARIPTVLTA